MTISPVATTPATVTAACVGIDYQAGEHETVQSYSRSPHSLVHGGRDYRGGYANDRGNGWADYFAPARLILKVTVDGEEHECWIDRHFRDAGVKRFTRKQLALIRGAMPTTIHVIERKGRKGKKYFEVATEDLEAWSKRTKNEKDPGVASELAFYRLGENLTKILREHFHDHAQIAQRSGTLLMQSGANVHTLRWELEKLHVRVQAEVKGRPISVHVGYDQEQLFNYRRRPGLYSPPELKATVVS